jgi:hypothetical protein
MDQSIKECHTDIITEEQEESSMSIQDQLELSLTRRSEIEFSQREFTLELSTLRNQLPDKVSLTELETMTSLKLKQIKLKKESQPKELMSNQLMLLPLKSQTFNMPIQRSLSKSYDRIFK